jgi:hypothetical protein
LNLCLVVAEKILRGLRLENGAVAYCKELRELVFVEDAKIELFSII